MTLIEEAAAEVRAVKAANDKRDADTRSLPVDHPVRREIRDAAQWVATMLAVLAAIETGQARVTLAVPVTEDPPGRAGEEGS